MIDTSVIRKDALKKIIKALFAQRGWQRDAVCGVFIGVGWATDGGSIRDGRAEQSFQWDAAPTLALRDPP